MKKTVLLILSLSLLFAGCGASGSAPDPTTAPTEVPTAAPPAPTEVPTAAPPAPPEVPTAAPPAPTDAPTATPAAKDYDGLVFSTTDRDGEPWDESVFAENALTMINFWEPWCGPCVGEMPDLQKLQDAYADRGFRILGVYQTEGMEADVDAVLADTGVTYPILHYTGAFDAFQSGYVPTTVFIDREGHVIGEGEEALYIGSNSYEGWAAIVEGLL